MNMSRVLILTRHFWPTTTDDTLYLLSWANKLRQLGYVPTVATPRWNPTWPRRMVCGEIEVKRLPNPPTNALRVGKYVRTVAEFVGGECERTDLIYCDLPDLEASAVLERLPHSGRPPVAVRFSLSADDRNRSRNPTRMVAGICRRADCLLVSTPAAHQCLLSLGIDNSAIVRRGASIGFELDRSPEARRAARQALCEVNHDLFVKSTDRVVVCPGELAMSWGVAGLIAGLRRLIERHRALRVWILGDGPDRGRIYELLRDDGLHHLVAMPGIFSDMKEVLQAADLCVFPAPGLGFHWLIPTCVRNSIPILCAESSEALALVGEHGDTCLFPAEQPSALEQHVADWLRNPDRLARVAHRMSLAAIRQVHTDPLMQRVAQLRGNTALRGSIVDAFPG